MRKNQCRRRRRKTELLGGLFQRSRGDRQARRVSFGFESLEDRRLLAFNPLFLSPAPDVNITQRAGGDAETTIAVNPTNPLNMIMGVNASGAFDTVWNTFDGGQNWTAQPIPNFPGSGAGGDPTVIYNRAGLAVYAHLSSGGLTSAVSNDGGNNWTPGQITPNGSGDDKEFLAVGSDFNNMTQDRFYVGWQRGGTLLVSSSVDGLNWTAAVAVSDGGNNGVDAQLAVGPQGEVYYAWETFDSPSRILFDKSTDGGVTWGTDQLVANRDITLVGPPPAGAIDCTPLTLQDDYCIPAAPNRGVSLSLSMDADRSGGPNHGNIYLAFMDQKNRDGATATPQERYDTDIYVVRSTDGGNSFSGLLRVNDDAANNSQFYPWLAVDQWSGNVGISWYDARNDTGAGGPGDTNNIPNDDAQYFSAVSFDGGMSFSPNVQASDGTSNGAAAGNFNYGDYTGAAYLNNVFHMVWADNSNSTGDNPAGALGTHDVYYSSAVLMGPDEFEANNTQGTATILGSLPKITLRDLTIDKPDDVDFFKYTAQDTGKLIVNLHFDDAFGNLDLRVRDMNSNVISSSSSTTDNEQIIIPVVSQEMYFIEVFSPAGDLNIYDLEIENFSAPVPSGVHLDPASDTGTLNNDHITNDKTPRFIVLADLTDFNDMGIDILSASEADAMLAGTGTTPGAAVEVFATNLTTGDDVRGFAEQIGTSTTLFDFTPAADLDGGVYFVTAAVRIFDGQENAAGNPDPATGRSRLSEPLWVTLDCTPPFKVVGDPFTLDDGLHPDSDSGVSGSPDTFIDRVTNDTTPTFFGFAEPGTVILGFVVTDDNGTPLNPDDDTLVLIGATVTDPDVGNSGAAGGWTLTSTVNMNDPNKLGALPYDGARLIRFFGRDVAGNLTDPMDLTIFIDTQGPQVTGVEITGNAAYNVFGPKPNATQGATPLINSLTINIQDLPDRVAAFLYNALEDRGTGGNPAADPGNYLLVGDASGVIAISNVIVTNIPPAANAPATATIELQFATPLPDDRFTLTILDSVVDPAGNALDGESNSIEPTGSPTFPSGDGQPGGDFVSRFTVDSRPELANYAGLTVTADINGNFSFDPDNVDAANRDLVFEFGSTSDQRFAGQFSLNGFNPGPVLFDALASYGRSGATYTLRIDSNLNGTFDPGIDFSNSTFTVDGLVVPFDFDPVNPGDEIIIFDGTTWHPFIVSGTSTVVAAAPFASAIAGYPIAGDFDGDGNDDLGTYQNDTFFFDFGAGGLAGLGDQNAVINSLFALGVGERPVAADMDQDGIDDIGLWIPTTITQSEATGEWRFLISNDPTGANRIAGTVNTLDHSFTPVPLGNDLSAAFGHPLSLPVVGNFDPPVAPSVAAPTPDQLGLSRESQYFYLDTNGNGTWDRVAGGDTFHDFGLNVLRDVAISIVGDWDGDGDDDLGLYNDGYFYLDTNGNGHWDGVAGGDTFRDFGINTIRATAVPVVGDWDGNGSDDLGLYNDGYFYLDTTGNGQWDRVAGGDTFRDFGLGSIVATAQPVIGDWDGNGSDDLGLFNDRYFYLDATGNGVWDRVAGGDTFYDFGFRGTPLIGDWDGDGVDDVGLHNDRYFYLDTTGNGAWDRVAGGDTFFDFGFVGRPLIGKWTSAAASSESALPASLEVAAAPIAYSNKAKPSDVNQNGVTTPQDALMIINAINNGELGALPLANPQAVYSGAMVDVNQDFQLTPHDVLAVINELNGQPEAEGEPFSILLIVQDRSLPPRLASSTPLANTSGTAALAETPGDLRSGSLLVLPTTASNAAPAVARRSDSERADALATRPLADPHPVREELFRQLGSQSLTIKIAEVDERADLLDAEIEQLLAESLTNDIKSEW